MDRLLLLDRMRDLYQRVVTAEKPEIFENLLRELEVSYVVTPDDLERIPKTGAAVVVANHPFGMLEGPILGSLLQRVRPDFKIMTNHLLSELPALGPYCIFVDPFEQNRGTGVNRRGLREALDWLGQGGLLVVFPAGEVSHFSLPRRELVDAAWSDTVVRLIRRTQAVTVPMFFCGGNSIPFYVLGLLNATLRTARLPHELLNKAGQTVEVRIGTPVPPKTIAGLENGQDATRYLRWRTYLLGERESSARPSAARLYPPLGQQAPGDLLASELAALPKVRLLEETREFAVYLAGAHEIPRTLQEIGRLREQTFREVGEGTGRPVDLDAYDAYYKHLVLWHKPLRQVAGSYRVGNTQEIVAQRGVRGLYTYRLFDFKQELLDSLGPSLELGRSFVRPEFQRQYAPLLLLWKGLGQYLLSHPETPVLFGAVSISNEYRPASRQLIAQFCRAALYRDDLASQAKARRPFRLQPLDDVNLELLGRLFTDVEDLSVPMSDIEPEGKGVPVLLRQYLKLGGRLLAFNVDPQFSNALDGLIVVDLRQTDRNFLDRYLGREGAARFLSYHGTVNAA